MEHDGTPRSPDLTTFPDETFSTNSPGDIQYASSIHAEFLRSLSVMPASLNIGLLDEVGPYTPQAHHYRGNFTPHDGLVILRQYMNSPTIFRLEQIPNTPIEFGIWASACCSSYFDRYHLHWPLIHRHTFDTQRDSLIVSATVVLIGAWLKGPEATRPLILETHKILVDQLLEQMVRFRVLE